MKFDELDAKMRVFETANDRSVLPTMFMVARIDGRNFTRLTKEVHKFEAPYDVRFRDMMIETTAHLMNSGFKTIYGYTQSDEISLLFHPAITTFDRKVRKYNSILAGEASARFSLLLQDHACFDSRISELPNVDLVVDYFRWRNEDAHRNALNAHCYWLLRKEGQTVQQATKALEKLSVAQKNELLWQRGINFNNLPLWQRRGMGLYWESYQKTGTNPVTEEVVTTTRKRVKKDLELPMRDEYGQFVRSLIESALAQES
ncbi:MAG TPA: tRNA(His) guanylyltransferase Thg1 family protein [Pyrinomonadaceae bacterium]|nr:tRNA(His) guanylyltransferase Thg1 family protein [Pyrinomonadaceae bacterium]